MSTVKEEGKAAKLQAVLLREIEATVEAMEEMPEIDRTLLELMIGHVQRFLVMQKLRRGKESSSEATAAGQWLLTRIEKLRAERAADLLAPEDETDMLKRLLESEDHELLTMQFDALISELDAAQSQGERLTTQLDVAAEPHPDLKQFELENEALKTQLLEMEDKMVNLKIDLASHVASRQMGQVALVDSPEAVQRREEMVEKYKTQLKEVGSRYRALEESYRALEAERNKLMGDLTEERKKLNAWMSTQESRVQQRAQELARMEMQKHSERLNLLNRIEQTHRIVRDGGGLVVVPNQVAQALGSKPGDGARQRPR